MKKRKPVHNLESLDSELQRLQQDARGISHQLSNELDNARQHFRSLTINSFKEELSKNEKIKMARHLFTTPLFNKMTEGLAEYLKGRVKKMFGTR